MEDEEKDCVIAATFGPKCMYAVKRKDTLAEVCLFIDEWTDDEYKVPNHLFKVIKIVIPNCQEVNNPTRPVFSEEV
eukprot:15325426-Ditylum_brightwellii.AAC.1